MNCSIQDIIVTLTTTYSPKQTTAEIHWLTIRLRVQFVTCQVVQQPWWFQQEHSVRTAGPRTEYAGYLVSDYTGNVRQAYRSSYICWDEAPEVAVGGTAQDQAVIYPVKVQCGSLPCSMYVSGRELTCIVCSKWWILCTNCHAKLTCISATFAYM